MAVKIAVLRMHVYLPGTSSLKDKRHRLKPLLARLHREFNVSAAEVGYQNEWSDALLGVALIGTNTRTAESMLRKISRWLEKNWPDVDLMGEDIEIIQ